MKKVTALVPCFNEEKTIGQVLKVLTNCALIDEIIVIDESTDNSKKEIKKFPQVKLFSIKQNRGKGGAVCQGLNFVRSPITFLCDADLFGLNHHHLKLLIEPVLMQEVEACIGVHVLGGKLHQFLRRNIFPLICGERAILTKHLKKTLKSPLSNNFGLETYMTHYLISKKIPFKKIDLKGVHGVFKWKKRGIKEALKEILSVGSTYFLLPFFEPKTVLIRLIYEPEKITKEILAYLSRACQRNS